MDILSIPQIITDGFILSLTLGVIVLASLYYNPRIWLNDYPKEIQAKVPPLTPVEKRQRLVILLLFLGAGVTVIAYSTSRLEAQGAPFLAVFLNAFLVFNIFNLFDAVVLDFLILTVMKPKFAIIPGAEGLEHLVYDARTQVGNYLKGIVFCTVLALVTAGIALL